MNPMEQFVDFLNKGGPAMYGLLALSVVSIGIVF